MNDWVQALQKARLNEAESPPKGWKTIDEIASTMGLRQAYAYRTVEDLITLGLAEKKKFRVKCGSLVRGKFHYKLK